MKNTQQSGFIKLIILFLIFCVIVWYFKLDIPGYINSHLQIKTALTQGINYLTSLWNQYLASAWSFIWDKIIVNVIWGQGLQPFLGHIFSNIPGKPA